jgi:cold shock CspA family protein
MTGIVKSYSVRHGYGWIRVQPGIPEIYFHASSLVRLDDGTGPYSAIPCGASVEFDLCRGNGGREPQAANVRLVKLPDAALHAAGEKNDRYRQVV